MLILVSLEKVKRHFLFSLSIHTIVQLNWYLLMGRTVRGMGGKQVNFSSEGDECSSRVTKYIIYKVFEAKS